jgi:hypothetical protein
MEPSPPQTEPVAPVAEPPPSAPLPAEEPPLRTGEVDEPLAAEVSADPPPEEAVPEAPDELPRRRASGSDLLRDVEEAAQRDLLEVGEEEEGDGWTFELSPPAETPDPVERPARFVERAQAALIDIGLLVGLWVVVVYFASRAARVSIEGLAPAWPFLLGARIPGAARPRLRGPLHRDHWPDPG